MRFPIFLLLMTVSLWGAAQHHHYIYIQGDNQQNFYIRKSGDVISSSVSGFVILPKIEPGQQQLLIGFPKNEFPEYEFTFEIRSKDRGFALKNFNEKGWGLFDLQSLEVIMGKKIEPKKETTGSDIGPLTDDPFSVILASVVDDPKIRETSLVYREPAIAVAIKQDTKPAEAVVKNETAKVENVETETANVEAPKTELGKTETAKVEAPKTELGKTETATTETAKTENAKTESPKTDSVFAKAGDLPKKDSKQQSAVPTESSAAKTSEASDREKEALVSSSNNAKDIAITQPSVVAAIPPVTREQVPADNTPAKEQLSTVKNGRVEKYSQYERDGELVIIYIDQQPGYADTIRLSIPENQFFVSADTLQEKQVIGLEVVTKPSVNKKGKQVQRGKPAKVEGPGVSASAVKTDSLSTGRHETRYDCKRMASEKDMVAMRKKMIMMTDDDAMIAAAVRDIKARCYSTERLQNLSYVFTTDKGRYKLFDAAFPYVYDPANYGQLERLLSDTYYIDRFRALIK